LNAPIILKVGNCNEKIILKLKEMDPLLVQDGDHIEMAEADDEQLPIIASTVTENNGLLYMLKRKENVLEKLFIDTVGEGGEEQ
jgi:ABC-2 type transport system ATP-binding protein